MTQITIVGNTAGSTMTSVEIVGYINRERMQIDLDGGKKYIELRHDNFMAKVASVLGEIQAPKFLGTSQYANGKGHLVDRYIYIFPKREATLLAMSYSHAVSAAVYDKMTELEQQVASKAPKLPNFSNPAEAARAWALEYERSEQLALVVEQKEVLLLEQAPKVDFVDQFVEADGALGIQAASRLLRMNMRELSHWLVDEKLCFGIPRIAQGRDSFVPAIAYHIFKSGTQDILSNSAHTSV